MPSGAGWVTYVRCHDDIGWAITDEDAGARRPGRARAPALPVRLLRRRLPGHVRARRALPAGPGLRRGADERDRGLAGRARAGARAGDELAVELAIRRMLLLYAVAFAHGGLPLIYMGDELGLRNDRGVGRRARARRRQPLDAPAADGLGGGRAAARPGPGRGPDVGRAAAARRGAPRDACGARAGRDAAGRGRATSTCSGCCASTPASGCWCSRTSPPSRSRSRRRRSRGLDFSPDERAGLVDGRPRELRGGELVLAPYQFVWIDG